MLNIEKKMIELKRFLITAVLAAASISVSYSVHAHGTDVEEPGFEEKPGDIVPLDAVVLNESAEEVRLGDLLGRPTFLVFQYYRCRDACGLILTNLAETLGEMDADPGQDYEILTMSIDERETPEDAREKKALIFSILEPGFPENAWRFLTGDVGSIDDLTDAVGFRYLRNGDVFTHPMGLVVLSPEGKIVRYMQGDRFLAADLRLAMLEASTGTIGPTVSRFVRFCFSVDPSGRGFTFNVLRVTGLVTVTFAASMLLLLFLRGRRRQPVKGGRN